MAVLDVHEVRPAARRDPGGADVVVHQLPQLGVRPHLLVRGDPEAPVQQRMAEGHPGLEAGLLVGAAEAPGVGQLEAHQEVVAPPEGPLVGRHQGLAQAGDPGGVLLVEDQLVGVGPPVRAHRHRLAPPDQLGPAEAEALPAPEHRRRDAPRGRPVPALHGLRAPAVPDPAPLQRGVEVQGAVEGRLGPRLGRLVRLQVDPQGPHLLVELPRGAQGGQLDQVHRAPPAPALPGAGSKNVGYGSPRASRRSSRASSRAW